MKVFPLMVMPALIFVLSIYSAGQSLSSSKEGSIALVDCKNCEDIIVKPSPVYPSYVGFGAHVWNGTVGVQVKIDREGNVTDAKAIYGHSYFRPFLESESRKIRFKPSKVRETDFSAVLIFEVTPPNYSEPIINGAASFLPRPVASKAAINACAAGELRVLVRVNKKGNVVSAVPLAGDPLLKPFAVSAAKRAKFKKTPGSPPIEMRGILVYNFPKPTGC